MQAVCSPWHETRTMMLACIRGVLQQQAMMQGEECPWLLVLFICWRREKRAGYGVSAGPQWQSQRQCKQGLLLRQLPACLHHVTRPDTPILRQRTWSPAYLYMGCRRPGRLQCKHRTCRRCIAGCTTGLAKPSPWPLYKNSRLGVEGPFPLPPQVAPAPCKAAQKPAPALVPSERPGIDLFRRAWLRAAHWARAFPEGVGVVGHRTQTARCRSHLSPGQVAATSPGPD